MADTIKNKVIRQAKVDAAAFTQEFEEPLNPAETDWDSEAYQQAVHEIGIAKDKEARDKYWPVYQKALVRETWKLTNKEGGE